VDSGSESDESEDEDGEQLTLGLDLEIMRTINRIRNKVSIYSKANNS
jgi:protein KRI1